LTQVVCSKSRLSFHRSEVMPGSAFPPPLGSYRGSLGPRFPTPTVQLPRDACPGGTMLCCDSLRPSRSVRFRLPSGTLAGRTRVCVPPGSRPVRFGCPRRPPATRQDVVAPVILAPVLTAKETGGSPEFPDDPSKHMPRSQTPVVSSPLHRRLWVRFPELILRPPLYIFRGSITRPASSPHLCFAHRLSTIALRFGYRPGG